MSHLGAAKILATATPHNYHFSVGILLAVEVGGEYVP